MTRNDWQDSRGNKDRSITRPGGSTLEQGSAPADRVETTNAFLVGDSMTVADISLASQLVNFKHGGEIIDPAKYPNLAAHTERMHALEPFAKTIEKESGFIQKVMGEAN